MRIEESGYAEVETIFSPEHFPDKMVNNSQILIVASSGHGKNLAEEKIIEKFHEEGYLIVVLTDKPKKPLEIGFSAFEPTAPYHKRYLNVQGIKPSHKTLQIYHPFVFDDWLKKPNVPVNFFTLPIKCLTPNELSVLLEVEYKHSSIPLLITTLNNLDKKQGIFEMFFMANKEIAKNEKDKKVEFHKDLFIPITLAGSKKTMSLIMSNFIPLTDKYYFLANEISELNIDYKKLLLNQKDYHILTTFLISDQYKKLKYFIINLFWNNLLVEYNKLCQDDKYAKRMHPILFVIQEAKVFLPDTSPETYIKNSALNFEEKLSTIRNVGKGCSTIADSQNIYSISRNYMDSVSELYFGSLASTDLERVAKTLKFSSEIKERLAKLPRNHYFKKGDTFERTFLFPSHAHCEEGKDFFSEFQLNYTHLIKDHMEAYNIAEQQYNIEKETAKARMEEMIRDNELKKLQKEKVKAKNIKDEKRLDTKKQEINEKEQKLKDKLYLDCFNEKQNNPDSSWVVIGKKFGINDKSAKKYHDLGKAIKEAKPEPIEPKEEKKNAIDEYMDDSDDDSI